MAPFDFDMAQILQKELYDHGVDLFVGDGVREITPAKVVLASGKEIPADAVVLAIGVHPETALARDAGLKLGETGAIRVSPDYRTSDFHIYAVGDAIEVYNRLTHKATRLPLAGPAIRQARNAADAIYGIAQHQQRCDRVLCGSGLRYECRRQTGLNERAARDGRNFI